MSVERRMEAPDMVRCPQTVIDTIIEESLFCAGLEGYD